LYATHSSTSNQPVLKLGGLAFAAGTSSGFFADGQSLYSDISGPFLAYHYSFKQMAQKSSFV